MTDHTARCARAGARTWLSGVVALALTAALGGCGGGGGLGGGGPRLSPEDFAAPAAETQVSNTETPSDGGGLTGGSQMTPDDWAAVDQSVDPRVEPRTVAPSRASGPRLIATPGEPIRGSANPDAVEAPVLINAKVGDINGRPIYADEFLEPMADRLRAEAQKRPPAAWRTFARGEIHNRIAGVLRDELLRAEAIASLTPEQKQGLRAFLQSFRDVKVRQSGGSSAAAERRSRDETGKTLDQTLKEEEEITLIRLTFIQEINKRVNVSWRDIVLRYEQDDEKYRPPPTARFRLVRVRTDEAQTVEMIGAAIEGGEPFEEVASRDENTWNPDEGGLHEAVYEGEYGEAEFFGASILNEQAWTLGQGEWTGPFELGSYTCWLKLEGIEQDSVPLYDAQLGIYTELLAERQDEELRRYIGRLIERARVTDLDGIRERLLEIATERYGPRG